MPLPKKILYPYKFKKDTWAIVVVMRNIALNLTRYNALSRNYNYSDTNVSSLLLIDQLIGKYDLLHIHSPTPFSVFSIILAKIQGKPSIFTGAYPPQKNKKFFPRYMLCSKLATVFCSISKRVEKLTYLNCGIKSLAVIPNGVDFNLFDPKKAVRPKIEAISHVKDYFVIVGAINNRKNSLFILNLAEKLPTENFIFAGNIQKDAAGFEEKAKKLNNVFIVGQCSREEVRNLMAFSKAKLFPTKEEGFGLVAAEALAMNKRVFAQPIEVMKEVLNGFEECHLISTDTIEEWIKKIESTDYTKQINNRELAKQKYSWQSISNQYQDIYDNILR